MLRVSKLADGSSGPGTLAAALPLVLNLSYVSATQTVYPTGQQSQQHLRVALSGAVALAGAAVETLVLASVPDPTTLRIASVLVNGHLASSSGEQTACLPYKPLKAAGVGCSPARLQMAGDPSLRANGEATLTSPPASFRGGSGVWFNSSIRVSAELLALVARQQRDYPIPWEEGDLDAPWLGSRLLLFPYITTPHLNRTLPRMWLNGTEVRLTRAYNSRGNEQARCFLGWFFDASGLREGTHAVAMQLPELQEAARLIGLFWRGLSDVWTADVDGSVTPLPSGNLSQCAEAGAAPEVPMPPEGAKNVLYLLVDDLRPQLEPYNQSTTYTPHVARFAQTATLFTNAYANVAVCSPSRLSFLSGRRPTTTHIYNFIDHIRQARCVDVQSATRWAGASARYRNISIDKTEGAAGECCTQCTRDPACRAWTYAGKTIQDGARAPDGDRAASSVGDDAGAGDRDHCELFGAGFDTGGGRVGAPIGTVSGRRGAFERLTALPQHFKASGYLTISSGKIWHTEEGDKFGRGMPPAQDAAHSWTPGCSMADVNEVANMWSCDKTPGTEGCPVDATADGEIQDGTAPLCDQVRGAPPREGGVQMGWLPTRADGLQARTRAATKLFAPPWL